MYEGNPVDLQMEKIISADGIFDDSTRKCRVYKYDLEEDYIYLELKEEDLTAISLDAKYRCYISTKTELHHNLPKGIFNYLSAHFLPLIRAYMRVNHKMSSNFPRLGGRTRNKKFQRENSFLYGVLHFCSR